MLNRFPLKKDLENTAADLLAYVGDDIAGALEYKLPPRSARRAFEYNGARYQVMLSRARRSRPFYLLSVRKEAEGEKWQCPDEADGAAIAAAFFPDGYTALPEEMDAARISRNYISFG